MYCKTNANHSTQTEHTSTMKVDVFTDGACTKNGRAGAEASWAFYFPEHKAVSNASRVPSCDTQTNQRGEMMAISEAVKAAEIAFPQHETELKIYTDSMYSKNCLTNWLGAWQRNNWKTAQGKDVMHRDLIEDTSARLSKFQSFNIVYVKAHTNSTDELSRNNHIVDRMAAAVLEPKDEKVVTTNTQSPFEDFPLRLMGPPVSEAELGEWCISNLNKLDQSFVKHALISALGKTLKTKGFEIEKQRLHSNAIYRLKMESGLLKEGVSIVKEE